ncbi:MAG: hypothetical protein RIR48_3299, partial [Bacteroidota bacterium]
ARGAQVTPEALKSNNGGVPTTAEGNHTMSLVRRSARGAQVTPEADRLRPDSVGTNKANNGKGGQVQQRQRNKEAGAPT